MLLLGLSGSAALAVAGAGVFAVAGIVGARSGPGHGTRVGRRFRGRRSGFRGLAAALMLFVAFAGIPGVALSVFLGGAVAEIVTPSTAAATSAGFPGGAAAARRHLRDFAAVLILFVTLAGATAVVTFPASLDMAFAETFAPAAATTVVRSP